MKYMSWGWGQLMEAPSDIRDEIVDMIAEENEEREQCNQ